MLSGVEQALRKAVRSQAGTGALGEVRHLMWKSRQHGKGFEKKAWGGKHREFCLGCGR